MPRESVSIGPFAVFFTNINRKMHLPGHSHHALVTLTYRTVEGNGGFPAFADTYRVVQERLIALTIHPFHDHTNEDVARALWGAFEGWTDHVIEKWGGSFALARVDFAVRGVPDAIGHADGFTTYTVEGEA